MEDSLNNLTSKMAHDVKNSISILKMLSYTMQEKISEEEFKILEEETDKINTLIEKYREDLTKL